MAKKANKKTEKNVNTTQEVVNDVQHIEIDEKIDINMVKEMGARLKATTEEAKRLEEENKAYEEQVAEYAELMDLASKELVSAEDRIKELEESNAKIRAEVTAEKITKEFQEAMDYKNKVINDANEKAKAIIAEAETKAQIVAKQITDEAQEEAEKQSKITSDLVKLQDETISKLKYLSAGIIATLKNDLGVEIIDDETLVKAQELNNVNQPKKEIVNIDDSKQTEPSQSSSTQTKTVQPEANGKWRDVKPKNSKASKNAELLKQRLKR